MRMTEDELIGVAVLSIFLAPAGGVRGSQVEDVSAWERFMQLTRRDLLSWGIVLGGGAALSSGRRVLQAANLPESPPTRPFVVELTRANGGIPATAQPVRPFATQADPADCVNVDGTTAFHVHGPRTVPANTDFFLIHERNTQHSFHPDLPLNDLWGYDGTGPGPTFVANSRTFPPPGVTGKAHLVRFVNDLVEGRLDVGEPITAIHRHGGFQNPEDAGCPLATFCFGEARDYF